MLINLAEIMSVKNQTKYVEVPLELDIFQKEGISYRFHEKHPVKLEITHEDGRKIHFHCTTECSLILPCSRCLEDVVVPFSIDREEELDFSLFKNEVPIDEQSEDATLEWNYIKGYDLDVDVLVNEELMLLFPGKVLCSEDCKGICNECGKNLNHESCDCHLQGKDPRMLAIQDIFKNFGQADD